MPANSFQSKPIVASSRSIGAAQVTALTDGKVKISFLPKTDRQGNLLPNQVSFSDGKTTKIFEPSDLPLEFVQGFDQILIVDYFNDKVQDFKPYKGRFKARFESFGRQPLDSPVPTVFEQEKSWKDDKKTEFFAYVFFRIEGNPMYDGVQMLYTIRLRMIDHTKGKVVNLAFTDKDGMCAFGFNIQPNGATGFEWSQKVLDLVHCGAYENPVPFSEDFSQILLALETAMKKANILVEIEVDKGYVVAINPVQSEVVGVRRKVQKEEPKASPEPTSPEISQVDDYEM